MNSLCVFLKVGTAAKTFFANFTLEVFDVFMNCFRVELKVIIVPKLLSTNITFIVPNTFMNRPNMIFEGLFSTKGKMANLASKLFDLVMNNLHMLSHIAGSCKKLVADIAQ
jgi:hypothetical protein